MMGVSEGPQYDIAQVTHTYTHCVLINKEFNFTSYSGYISRIFSGRGQEMGYSVKRGDFLINYMVG